MEQHEQINLYLDRDSAGLKYLDGSQLYQRHKDLNDYLVRQGHQQKHSQKIGRHL
jgi:hypothetical protein